MKIWIKLLQWCGWRSQCCGSKIFWWSIDLIGDRQKGFCVKCEERI